MDKYPKWLYKKNDAIIVESKEEEDLYDKTWLDNPSKDFNTRNVVKESISLSIEEKI